MKVLVLMSVYNGEKYLSEQIESILAQDCHNVELLMRDDESTDNSVNIIRKYAERNENIKWYEGKNCGVWKSFMELVRHAEETYDYYAFSDQDDVWLPEKIRKAVEVLQEMEQIYGKGIPLQYGSNICPVNEKLEKIDTGINLTKFTPSFGSSLVQGITSGLTCVFNQEALLLIKKSRPNFMIMHDWWLYMTVSCYGRVYYDDHAYVLYRQHGSNMCGARTSKLERLKYRLNHYNERRRDVLKQVREFLKCYDDIPEENRKLAELLCDSQKNLWKRILLIFNGKIKRQRFWDNVVYKILVLFGYL